MRDRVGVIVSIAASVGVLVVLVWPYAVRSAYDVNTYYGGGVLNPLLAGILVLGVIVALAATRADYVSRALGAGLAIGLGLFAVLASAAWAVTARLDVFLAPGWALPAQRFVLVGLSLLVVLGMVWHVWANGLLVFDR